MDVKIGIFTLLQMVIASAQLIPEYNLTQFTINGSDYGNITIFYASTAEDVENKTAFEWIERANLKAETVFPKFPEDFQFSTNAVPAKRCVLLNEPKEQQYQSVWLCHNKTKKDADIFWSHEGKRPLFDCTHITSPYGEDSLRFWDDNFLCVGNNSVYKFHWSGNGTMVGLGCLEWPSENENAGRKAFLCANYYNGLDEDIEVHEFDMRFPIAQSGASEGEHDAPIRDRSALWPGGVIPYEFGNSIKNRRWFVKLIRGAMDEWEAKTCIKFQPKSTYENNYVHIHVGHGCNSDVGMVGGRQTVSLGNGCAHHSVVLHELGHVVGFWHEQNRPDRDQHVKIVRENIIKKLYFAFHKYSHHKINSLGVPYDYKSIMHYSSKAFSKNSKDTIIALDGKTREFGNSHLSALDILQTNKLYKCPDKANKYPNFPEDFRFSFTRLTSHQCTRLYEPRDRLWVHVYLCVKSGKKSVKIRWSNKGALRKMACTRIYSNEKHYYQGWGDNHLCVPVQSPYKFRWSVNGPISGYQCLQWKYSQDRRWGSRKYLCAKSDDKPVNGGWSPWSMWSQCTKKCGRGYQHRRRDCTNPRPKNGGRSCGAQSYETRYCNKQRCEDLPNWPDDFTYRYHPHTPSSSTCIRTYERANYFQWTNYYFCSRSGRRDINMKWSDNGPIRNMKCVLINEPREPRRNGWYNNYLCVPRSSPYNFRWSHSGQIHGLSCIRWMAKRGYDGWSNNFLCAERFDGKSAVTTKPVHGGWTAWGRWTKCTKTCDRGTRRRFRSCSNPYPKNGGRSCRGGREEITHCKIMDCPKVCDFEHSRRSGIFRSPANHRGQISCSWTIKVPAGNKVILQFWYFRVGVKRSDCTRGSDYVTVRDGGYSTSTLIKSLCGSTRPRAIESSSNAIRVTLKSAKHLGHPGFTIAWSSVLLPTIPPTTVKPTTIAVTTKKIIKAIERCGGTLTELTGTITTPKYPNKYPTRKNCVWIIKVPVHKLLKLRFVSMDVESHARCENDFVEVRDGSSNRSTLLGKFCGNTLPKEITAFANSLWIRFHSDNSHTRSGFKAVYHTEKRTVVDCGRRWRSFVSEDGFRYCYLIRQRRATWSQARDDCKRRGSDLLSIATKQEQWFVRNELMAETKYYELWMGFNDKRKEGTWAWSDKSEVNFNNWGGGDPNNGGRRNNEDCGVVKPDGRWNDFPCNHRFMYICKKKVS